MTHPFGGENYEGEPTDKFGDLGRYAQEDMPFLHDLGLPPMYELDEAVRTAALERMRNALGRAPTPIISPDYSDRTAQAPLPYGERPEDNPMAPGVTP